MRSNGIAGAILNRYVFAYDKAGNRTSEQIDLGVSTAAHNNLNQLTNLTASGGPVRFRGRLNEIGTVTVSGASATFDTRNSNFVGYVQTTAGTNIIPIVATDYSHNKATNRYQLVVTNNGVAKALGFDSNGNLTNLVTATSTNSYEWDANNRLTGIEIKEINQAAKRSEFTYDALNHRVRILERTNGAIESDNYYVWCSGDICQKRNTSGAIVNRRYFGAGEQISGTNHWYTRDHLGSIREMLEDSQAVQARYEYGPYGLRTSLISNTEPDASYTGHFYHGQSRLYLTRYRGMDSRTGRWLSRDPIAERGGLNLYLYALNNPVFYRDPQGLDVVVLQNEGWPNHEAVLISNGAGGWAYSGFSGVGLVSGFDIHSPGVVQMFHNSSITPTQNLPEGCHVTEYYSTSPKTDQYLINMANRMYQNPPQYNAAFQNCQHYVNMFTQAAINAALQPISNVNVNAPPANLDFGPLNSDFGPFKK